MWIYLVVTGSLCFIAGILVGVWLSYEAIKEND